MEHEEVVLNDQPKKNSLLREIVSYIMIIIIAYAAAKLINYYFFINAKVDGDSMLPTINNDDKLFLWRTKQFEHFDVVVFEAPNGDYYIKRLIGLPGDYVEVTNNQLFINGVKYEEPYLKDNEYTGDFQLEDYCFEDYITKTSLTCSINGKIQIPEGYYFVLGDNRNNSTDSRIIGLINDDKFVGEAKFIFFPIKRIRIIH